MSLDHTITIDHLIINGKIANYCEKISQYASIIENIKRNDRDGDIEYYTNMLNELIRTNGNINFTIMPTFNVIKLLPTSEQEYYQQLMTIDVDVNSITILDDEREYISKWNTKGTINLTHYILHFTRVPSFIEDLFRNKKLSFNNFEGSLAWDIYNNWSKRFQHVLRTGTFDEIVDMNNDRKHLGFRLNFGGSDHDDFLINNLFYRTACMILINKLIDNDIFTIHDFDIRVYDGSNNGHNSYHLLDKKFNKILNDQPTEDLDCLINKCQYYKDCDIDIQMNGGGDECIPECLVQDLSDMYLTNDFS